MMTQAFYTGLSGLKTNSTAIDAVSDNLANISTVGYRGYNVEFASLYEDSIAAATSDNIVGNSVGIGSQVQTTSMIQGNGSLILSDKNTDLAIDGDGWFGVTGNGDSLYTRNGGFTFDNNSDLVTADGYYVLGTVGGNISADGVLTSKLDSIPLGDVNSQEPLRYPQNLTFPPSPTTDAKFMGNLGIESIVRKVSSSVIDSQGDKNSLSLEFTKNETQTLPGSQWSIVATTHSLDGETLYDTQTGDLEFDATGALLSHTLTTIDNNGSLVNIDLGSGYDGIVSTSGFVVSGSSESNGSMGGDLVGYEINVNAEVIATFTNGEQSSVGKVAVFHFQNEQGLDRLSGSTFQQSSNSGNPMFLTNAAGENVIGASITNYKLESSNYEMSSGLTELIIFQRAYDANSKSITTADEMMQKALNMDA